MAAPISLSNDPSKPGGATPVYSTCHASVLCTTQNTLAKAGAGTVGVVNVLVAGSTTGAVYDAATAATASLSATANLVALIPPAVGPIVLNFPCLTGIVVQPGAGQTLSVSYA